MPKYRLLSLEELKEMEKEFVDFLVLNSIMPEDWEKLKSEKKADPIIEQFSDVVFETILRKVTYLEHREEKNMMAYHCLPNALVLVGMEADSGSEINFLDPAYLQMAHMTPPGSLRIYTTEKKYTNNREQELFDMIQKGCTISDGKLFKSLCLALKP